MRTKREHSRALAEPDAKPFMNLLIVLVPLLLLSAEFARIAIIDIGTAAGRGASVDKPDTTAPDDDKAGKLLLTAIITDSAVTLGTSAGFLPSIHYREYHRYVAADDGAERTVEYRPGEVVRHPRSGRPLSVHERYDILLHATDERGQVRQALYSRQGELVTDGRGVVASAVRPGDTLYAVGQPRRMVRREELAGLALRPLSVYDELANRLVMVREGYRTAAPRDPDDIIVAAENEVLYDKIVQIMDVARLAGFANIMIAKVRA